MVEEQLKDIINMLEEIQNDNTVPKNVKVKIQESVDALNEEKELSLKVDKALHVLDELSNDTNMQPYTRTQLWNVVSMLEMLLS